MIKIVHLNTEINNSSAPYKLHKAMLKAGLDSKILTIKNLLDDASSDEVYEVHRNAIYKIERKFSDINRDKILSKYDRDKNMPFDVHAAGVNLVNHPFVKAADIVWVHWINGNFQTGKSIRALIDAGKKVLWTCHDNFPFTGGCHVRMGCEGYKSSCGKCPILKSEDCKDSSYLLLKEKERYLKGTDLAFTVPSKWMEENIKGSSLFSMHKHFLLPNIIDTESFKPYDKLKSREEYGLDKDAFIILLAPKANENIPYNGMNYLWEAVEKVNSLNPDSNLQFVAFGVKELSNKTNADVKNLGYIKGEEALSKLYSAADMMLITSLEDSFNMTAAECMACNTPVVAFNNGGIADIIDHKKNGYLAKLSDSEDLIEGVKYLKSWLIENRDNEKLDIRQKIVNNFSEEVIIEKIKMIFDSL